MVAARSGDYATAQVQFEEALTKRRMARDKWSVALVLDLLGQLARLQGDLVRATEFHRECLGLYGAMGAKGSLAQVLHHLATVAQLRNQLDRAARSGRPFGFAGIWSSYRTPMGQRVGTCAILTCAPMPVILPPTARDCWLDRNADAAALREVLAPLSAAEMGAYPVSSFVNSPRNDSPECVRRVGGWLGQPVL